MALSSLLVACHAVPVGYVPLSELEEFNAMPVEKRPLTMVKMRWEIREDVTRYCAEAAGMDREQAYAKPPLACAIWSVATRECTIVTGKVTTHALIGHETRHCFEGHFHP